MGGRPPGWWLTVVYALAVVVLALFVIALVFFVIRALTVPGELVPGLFWAGFALACAGWWASRLDRDFWRGDRQ